MMIVSILAGLCRELVISIFFMKQKTSPNRFIVQWNKVSTISSGTTTPDNMTFEVILNQDAGTIEYRYAAMNTTGTTPAYGASTAIEDQSGTLRPTLTAPTFPPPPTPPP